MHPWHRHREFIRLLNRIEAAVPAGRLVRVVLDDDASHEHPKVLARHRRRTFHFTPVSASPSGPPGPDHCVDGSIGCRDRRSNAVEGFFAKLAGRRLQRGVSHPPVGLRAAIQRYLAEHDTDPKPFVRTADPNAVIAAASRGYQLSD